MAELLTPSKGFQPRDNPHQSKKEGTEKEKSKEQGVAERNHDVLTSTSCATHHLTKRTERNLQQYKGERASSRVGAGLLLAGTNPPEEVISFKCVIISESNSYLPQAPF